MKPSISIALIGCSGRSTSHCPVPARQMYASQLFRSSLTLAEKRHDVIYMVNARHELVTLDQVIEPCNYTTSAISLHWRRMWGDHVWESILGRHPNEDRQVFIYASNNDARPIHRAGKTQATFHEPFAKMRISQRLRWLSEQLDAKRHA